MDDVRQRRGRSSRRSGARAQSNDRVGSGGAASGTGKRQRRARLVVPERRCQRRRARAATRISSASSRRGSPVFNVYNAGVNVNYTLDLFGSVRRGVEAQSALTDFQQFQLEGTYLSLAANVVTTHVSAKPRCVDRSRRPKKSSVSISSSLIWSRSSTRSARNRWPMCSSSVRRSRPCARSCPRCGNSWPRRRRNSRCISANFRRKASSLRSISMR